MVAFQKTSVLALAAGSAYALSNNGYAIVTASGNFAALVVNTQAWDGRVYGAWQTFFPVVQQTNATLFKLAGSIKSDSTYSTADAQTVVNYVNKYLEPNVKNAVTAFQSQKSSATSSGLKSTVHDFLQGFQDEARWVNGNFSSKFPSDQRGALDNAFWKVITDLQTGIDDFNN